jgi:hypothetical protein
MATAPLVRRSSLTLHQRGTWSARDDRTASAVWLGILWVGMLAGFGVDIPRFAHENPAAPAIIYLHAAVFIVWLLFLTAQVTLVLRDRVAWHRKLGWFSAGWATLMAVLGPWAALASDAVNLHNPAVGDPPFISVNIVDIAGFIALLAWGIALRKNPAAHRRMMILATVSLADPGYARFSAWLMPEPASAVPWFLYVFYGNALIILLMAAWDAWKGRLMRSFVFGATGLLAGEFVASLLYFWGPWKELTSSWVVAWATHFT